MKHTNYIPAFLLALTVTSLGACNRGPSGSQAMSDKCDMEGMDMSKMSAEEHQKMMEDCEKAKAQGGQ